MGRTKLNTTANILVLSSGGLDSTACIAYYLMRGYRPQALWVDYGQKAREPELRAITTLADHYSIELKTVKVIGITWQTIHRNDEIMGRNLLLASIGISSFPNSSGLVAIGIHSSTDYLDCSPVFMEQLSELARILSDGCVEMDFPFSTWTKGDILEFCKQHDVPINLTYSCLEGVDPPCGDCTSCQDRKQLGI